MSEPDYYWIKYDVPAIMSYQQDLLNTIEFIKDELPDINWNSTLETIDYFEFMFNIVLNSTRIEELQTVLGVCEYASEIIDREVAKEELQGLLELKKLQSIVRNYTSQILKHVDKHGVYPLRCVEGKWLQQNKRELPYDSNIKECIIEMHIPQEADKGAKEI